MNAEVLTWWARHGGTAKEMLNNWITNNPDKKIVSIAATDSGDTTASRRVTYTILWERNV